MLIAVIISQLLVADKNLWLNLFRSMTNSTLNYNNATNTTRKTIREAIKNSNQHHKSTKSKRSLSILIYFPFHDATYLSAHGLPSLRT